MIININEPTPREKRKQEELNRLERETEKRMDAIYEEERENLRASAFRQMNNAGGDEMPASLMILAKMMAAGEEHRERKAEIERRYSKPRKPRKKAE